MKCERCKKPKTVEACYRCGHMFCSRCRSRRGVCSTCYTAGFYGPPDDKPAERNEHTEDAKSYFEWLARDLPRRA